MKKLEKIWYVTSITIMVLFLIHLVLAIRQESASVKNNADINHDGIVDYKDVSLMSQQYGERK